MRIVSHSFIFQGLSTTIIILFRTVGTVKVSFFTSLASFYVNVFLNYVLIFGNFGAPALGIQGVAIATLSARIIEFLCLSFYVLRVDRKLKVKIKDLLTFDGMLFKKYLSIGGPVLISDVILALGLNMIAIIMGRIGSDLVAANRISNVVLQFTDVCLMGIASASGVIVGNTIGTVKTEEAYHRDVTFFLISSIHR